MVADGAFNAVEEGCGDRGGHTCKAGTIGLGRLPADAVRKRRT